jgi:hypothetical protein
VSVLLKIFRAISILIGLSFLMAASYSAIGMSSDGLMKARIVLGTVGIFFFLLAWLATIAISNKEKNIIPKHSFLSLYIQKDTAEYIIFEYKTGNFYFLCIALGLGLLGVVFENISIASLCMFLIFLQFLISFPEQRKLSKIIKKSSDFGVYELSGSKFSFEKPLTVRIKKINSIKAPIGNQDVADLNT